MALIYVIIKSFLLLLVSPQQLPRNYYPRVQDLQLNIDFDNDVIRGFTRIYLGHENSNSSDKTITFNFFNETLELGEIVIRESWGETYRKLEVTSIEKNEEREQVKLEFTGTTNSRIALEIENPEHVGRKMEEKDGETTV